MPRILQIKDLDFKTKITEYVIIQIRVCYIVLYCYTLLFNTGHDNVVENCMYRKKNWPNDTKRAEQQQQQS